MGRNLKKKKKKKDKHLQKTKQKNKTKLKPCPRQKNVTNDRTSLKSNPWQHFILFSTDLSERKSIKKYKKSQIGKKFKQKKKKGRKNLQKKFKKIKQNPKK